MFIGHDLGTGSDKAVLVTAKGEVIATAVADYPIDHPEPGYAEQDPSLWWEAVCKTTKALLGESKVDPEAVRGLCFAGQMLALVPVDSSGTPTRPAISWMDSRASVQARRIIRRFGGEWILSALAGGTPTGKDLIAKVAWIAEHEPAVFRETAAFCDATGYLVGKATGKVRMDPTAAGGTGLFDATRRRWSTVLAKLSGFPVHKMAPIAASGSCVGNLTPEAANALGLSTRTKVAMGMADIPAAAVGSGAVHPGQAHVYLGTSAWIAVTVNGRKSVPQAGIASVPSANREGCLMIGESETAGACRDWVSRITGIEQAAIDKMASEAPPGANGLLFCPWLYGERTPVPDEHVRGAFLNLGLSHGKNEVLRAVLEGVAHNLAWTVSEMGKVRERCSKLRAIGGGAQSDLWLQILADVTGRPIERVENPRLAGAIGAALMGAVAVGALPSVTAIGAIIRTDRSFRPNLANRQIYRKAGSTFRAAYPPLAMIGRRIWAA